MERDLFDKERLPPALDEFLRRSNPWWEGKPGVEIPPYRRWLFNWLLTNLKAGPTPGLILRGPRQVGKTTLQNQLIEHLIKEEKFDPRRILRVQFDEIPSMKGLADPILSISRWFESRILGKTFNEKAREGEPAFIIFDEVQNLPSWAPQLKALVDHNAVRVLVTGSSALRIKLDQDSLAGRVRSVNLGPLFLREISGIRFREEIPPLLAHNDIASLKRAETWEELNELGERHRELRDRAFRAFSERGAYPVTQARADQPWEELAEYLNEFVVERAIRHDLQVGSKGRKRDPQLLEEVFRLACRYAGQAPGQPIMTQQIKTALDADISWQRVRNYLQFLDDTLLIRLIPPLELRLKKKKGTDKICLCDPAIRAAWLQEPIPLAPEELDRNPVQADLAGHIAESVAGYFFSQLPGVRVHHFPEKGAEPEVDFVLTIGDLRIPVEVKYQSQITERDTRGLRAFIGKTVYNAEFGVLITRREGIKVRDPRIVPVSLRNLLLLR